MFEDWSINQPDNFPFPLIGIGEDCTLIRNTGCGENSQSFNGQPDFCRWNDAPCTFSSISGDVLRPICKQEQTVYVFEAKSL